MTWNRDLEAMPKDKPILALCRHKCESPICGYHTGVGTSLCLYHGHAEGLSHVSDGSHVLEWGGGWADSQDDGGGYMPDWWFRSDSEPSRLPNALPLSRHHGAFSKYRPLDTMCRRSHHGAAYIGSYTGSFRHLLAGSLGGCVIGKIANANAIDVGNDIAQVRGGCGAASIKDRQDLNRAELVRVEHRLVPQFVMPHNRRIHVCGNKKMHYAVQLF